MCYKMKHNFSKKMWAKRWWLGESGRRFEENLKRISGRLFRRILTKKIEVKEDFYKNKEPDDPGNEIIPIRKWILELKKKKGK